VLKLGESDRCDPPSLPHLQLAEMKGKKRHFLSFKLLIQFCCLVGVSLSFSSSALAQAVNSSIIGFVTDSQGAAIPAATVTLTNTTIGIERIAKTSEQGFYSINAVPPGTYSIQAEATGFTRLTKDNLNLVSGITSKVNFALSLPDLTGEVTVFDSGSSNLGTVMEKRQIQELPLDGRSFYELALLVPGATASHPNALRIPTLNGASGSETKYVVDGGETTNASVGGAATLPALDAVKSIQMVIGNFSADVGRFGGNLLNIAVRSGTNEFHGDASFSFRDDSLQARSPFGGSSKPAFGSQRVGFSVGGPIKRDVAFFYTQFDRDSDKEVTTAGTRDVIQRRIVPGYAAVPFYAINFTTKLDVNLPHADTLTARYTLEDGHGITPGLSQSGRLQDETNFQTQLNRQHQFVSSWVRVFSPYINNVALFNFVSSRDESQPVTTRPQIVFPSLNVGANFHADRTSRQTRVQFKDDVNWLVGEHSIKFGTDYNHISLPESNNFNLFGPGLIFVPCDFAGEAGCPSATTDDQIPVLFSLINRQTLMNGPAPVNTRGVIPAISDNTLALYVQDDYRITPDVRLTFGWRWDYDQDFIGLNQTNQARPGVRKSRKKNHQPRVGVVWTIGRVIIRGGYGTYYRQNFLQTRQLELLVNGTRLPLVRSFGGTLGNPFGGIGPGTPPDVFVTNNELKEPFVHTFSAAAEIDLGKFSFSTALITRRARNSTLRVEVNRNEDGSRVNSQFGSVLETQSIGRSAYDGLSFEVTRPLWSGDSFIRHFSLNGAYTLSRTKDQANELISFLSSVSDPADPDLDPGPSSYDARHRFHFSGIVDLPHNITLSSIINAQSSVPFEIIQNHDFSEGSASGFYRLPVVGRNAGSSQLRTGADVNRAIDAFNANSAFVLAHGGPIAHVDPNVDLTNSYFTVALRVSKRWMLKETKDLEVSADIFNLFNHTNVLGLSGANSSGLQNNVESPNFGRPLGITAGGGVFDPAASRALQLTARFTF
jgi:TonB dependent receptor/Carboxypeptidase regulatory-like domain